ncbi:hypothetical protein Barb6_01994 [Bacteroidales bacterium Barb6]|nr:hypothetical protein Barb6_01994 [Bacteroidales bacterium Barb6]
MKLKQSIKGNWLAGTAVVISVVSLCLCALRIEPIEVGSGTVVGVGVGLIGVCAAVMVVAQVYGLHYSEEKMRKELDARADKILNEANNSIMNTLFRTEMVRVVDSYFRGDWVIFAEEIKIATECAVNLNDKEKAMRVNSFLLTSQQAFSLYKLLNEPERRKLDECVIKIAKLVDNPRPLLDAFKTEAKAEKCTP